MLAILILAVAGIIVYSLAKQPQETVTPPTVRPFGVSLLPTPVGIDVVDTGTSLGQVPTPITPKFGSSPPLGIPQESESLWFVQQLMQARQVVDPDQLPGMRVYFQTHQPGEWWLDPASRNYFEAIYGAEALRILDWSCTVPENVDPQWQTVPGEEYHYPAFPQ